MLKKIFKDYSKIIIKYFINRTFLNKVKEFIRK